MSADLPRVVQQVYAPSCRLRPLASADFDRVLQLERVLFGEGAWTYGMLADELAGLGRWYVVAEPTGPDAAAVYGPGPKPVVGYAGLWFDGDVAQVMTIGVDPHYQRHGVGRALLEALIERSRKLKAGALLLEVRVDNEPALALYERFGFERIGLRKRYYQPEDKDAFTMRLDLSAAPVAPAQAAADDAPDTGSSTGPSTGSGTDPGDGPDTPVGDAA